MPRTAAPFTFVLPSDVFVDGPTVLEAEASMRDGFVSPRTSVTLNFANGVSVPPAAPTGFIPTSGTAPAPGGPFVVVATGDGASGQTSSDDVANTALSLNPNLFLYLGDVYERGTYTEFKNWYGEGTRFGALASITNPTLGNHETELGAWPGYDRYWGTPDPHYSYEANGWHFISMKNLLTGPGAAQTAWLAADLAANTADCTIAYFHYPVLSVGVRGDTPSLFSTWAQLVDAGVDVVLTAHDHSYQRWLPMDRNLAADPVGATQFVLGAGGHGVQSFVRADPRLAAGADTVPDAFGALRLNLNSSGAAFSYVNTAGASLDSGTIQCSGTPADQISPTVPANVAADALSATQVELIWSPSTDNVGVDSYTIYRDGAPVATVAGAQPSYTDATTQPLTTYSYTVEASDAAGNVSGQSTPMTVVTPPPPPTSITLIPVADSYVEGASAGSNYGTRVSMLVDGSPDKRSYVRFDVAGVSGAVTSATLRVYANSTHSQGYEVQGVADNGWNELTITYANAPGFGPLLGTSGAVSAGSYAEIDVTGYVTGNGSFSFALTPLNNTNLRLSAREDSANPPELIVDTGAPPLDTEAPTAPTQLAATGVQATQVTLGWVASMDNVAVTGYDVYRDGGLLESIGVATSYQDNTVTPETTYLSEVYARDAAGNVSDASNPLTVLATVLTFDVARAGSIYTAVSQAASYSGTLKSVVESALEDMKLSGGGNVFFPAGDFDLGSEHFEINGVTDVTFAGQGMGVTTIRNFTNEEADTEPFDVVRSDRLTIRDLTVSAGGSDRTTSDALDFDGGDDILIERVEVTDSRGCGIIFDGKDPVSATGGTADRNVVRDCVVSGVPRDGIQLLAANNNTIENCQISNTGREGIRVHKGGSSAGQPNKPSNDNLIIGNVITDAAGNGIRVASGNRNVMSGNTVLNSGADGILIHSSVVGLGCDDNVVQLNTAHGNLYGLNISSSACNRTVVGDNDFSGNSSGSILDNGTDTIYASSDTEAPTAPSLLAATGVQATQVTLGWVASTDNIAVTGYDVYRDGGLIGSVGVVTAYQDGTVAPETTYEYEVYARDAAGNVSDPKQCRHDLDARRAARSDPWPE